LQSSIFDLEQSIPRACNRMAKARTLAVVALALTAYSDEVLSHDDALSLLQTRAQKHVFNQEGAEEGTLADGSKLRLGAIGTVCADDEDITFTKCVETSRRQIITHAPDVWGTSSLGLKRNLFSDGPLPRGCFLLGTTMYYNDQPIGNVRSETRPICQVGGGGGMNDFVAANGLSCRGNPDCKGRGYKRLDWNDALFVPEMKLGTAGGVCEEGCGLLTMEQCTKAGDMGLIDEITPGFKVREQPRHQLYGATHTMGTLPSGCSVMLGHGVALPYFNSWDTEMGATSAPDGGPMVTASGVGSGWAQVTPICGVCTTTTTTTAAAVAEPKDDEAGAVADPHLTTNNGNHFDYELPALVQSSPRHHHR